MPSTAKQWIFAVILLLAVTLGLCIITFVMSVLFDIQQYLRTSLFVYGPLTGLIAGAVLTSLSFWVKRHIVSKTIPR